MSNIIICGAGPIGLYLAIRLKKMGIKNIIVLDPRAGDYTRPGHLEKQSFDLANKNLNIPMKTTENANHIKDFERQLFEAATLLNIQFEKKTLWVSLINLIKTECSFAMTRVMMMR